MSCTSRIHIRHLYASHNSSLVVETATAPAARAPHTSRLSVNSPLAISGCGTTLTYPPRASHRDLSPDELAAIGITMGQIRLSSGLEDTDDLLNDFDQALAKM